MGVRIEHDVNGQHQSSFGDYENISSLVRAALQYDDIEALVITQKGVEKRFVPERPATADGREPES